MSIYISVDNYLPISVITYHRFDAAIIQRQREIFVGENIRL